MLTVYLSKGIVWYPIFADRAFLPGGVIPENRDVISSRDYDITILLKIDDILLDYSKSWLLTLQTQLIALEIKTI